MTRFRRCLALTLMAPTLMWAWGFDANAQDQVFVSIANYPGESTDANHTGWIDAYALDEGLSVPAPGARANFNDVAILKGTDKATPKLQDALASAVSMPLVIIEVCRAGTSPQQCYYRVELSSASVSGVSLSGSSAAGSGTCTPAMTESVSFRYDQIKWIYTPWTNGSPGTQQTHFWKITQNQGG